MTSYHPNIWSIVFTGKCTPRNSWNHLSDLPNLPTFPKNEDFLLDLKMSHMQNQQTKKAICEAGARQVELQCTTLLRDASDSAWLTYLLTKEGVFLAWGLASATSFASDPFKSKWCFWLVCTSLHVFAFCFYLLSWQGLFAYLVASFSIVTQIPWSLDCEGSDHHANNKQGHTQFPKAWKEKSTQHHLPTLPKEMHTSSVRDARGIISLLCRMPNMSCLIKW